MGALKAVDQQIHFLTSTTEAGFTMYFYLRLNPAKKQLFLKAMKQEAPLNLHDYGAVLASGIGEIPSAESAARMLAEFGYVAPPSA